jgi:hypothetical protein
LSRTKLPTHPRKEMIPAKIQSVVERNRNDWLWSNKPEKFKYENNEITQIITYIRLHNAKIVWHCVVNSTKEIVSVDYKKHPLSLSEHTIQYNL